MKKITEQLQFSGYENTSGYTYKSEVISSCTDDYNADVQKRIDEISAMSDEEFASEVWGYDIFDDNLCDENTDTEISVVFFDDDDNEIARRDIFASQVLEIINK